MESNVLLPVLNLQYECLEGEIWKEIPNLDGVFYISNYGRIKSIDRAIYTKNRRTIFYKGRMYKPVLIKYKNNALNDYAYELKTGISYIGKNYNLRVARLVYSLFVKELTAEHKQMIVYCKDGNRQNVCTDNLELQTISEKQQRMFNNNRCIPIYSFKTEETYRKIAVARSKSVTKFSVDGIPLKTYNSIKEASIENNVNSAGIIAAIKHRRMIHCGGFLWGYGNSVENTI